MWFLTVVGPVHGQRQFTFALEQDHTYTIGRDKNADIPVDSRRLKTKEGRLEIGHWNPDEHLTPPTIIYYSEPKQSGAPSPVKILSPLTTESDPSDRDGYDIAEYAGDSAIQLEAGKGVDYGEGAWFYLQWKPLHFTNDKMKDVDDAEREHLRKYCVSWNQSFDVNDLPDVVVSETYRNSQDCNYAMCYGIPIVTHAWLQLLGFKVKACWKKTADSEDSFRIPSPESEEVRPKLDPALKNRLSLSFWKPDPSRRHMWSKWNVLELKKPRGALLDARYYRAMGAALEEVDVLDPLITTPAAFIDLIASLISKAQENGRKSIVVWLPPTRDAMNQKGVDFNAVVVGACEAHGVYCAGGSILWNAMRYGSVQNYLDTAAEKATAVQAESTPQTAASAPDPAPQQEPAPSSPQPPAEASAPKGRLPRRAAGSRSVSRAPSVPPPTAPPTDPAPIAEEDNAAPSAPSSTATRKPLRRRAGRGAQRMELDLDDDIPAPTPMSSQPSRIPETQLSEAVHQSLASRVPDSMEVDSQDTPQPSQANSVFPSQNPPPRSSRLKRRAGIAPAASSFLDGLDTSVQYEEELKKQETANEIRELYEQSKRESASLASMPPAKRARREGPDSIAEEAESVRTRESREDLMEIDAENDFVTRALRSARVKKEPISPAKRTKSPEKGAQPPSKKVLTSDQARRARRASSSEDDEPVEEPRSRSKSSAAAKSAPSPAKRGAKATVMTTDENFLQAVAKAKRKNKEMEELDREFNELRIPKANNKRGTDPAVRANHISDNGPDYGILNDFDDDMRGNFIQVVRRDLFRKDTPKVPQMVDDGRPNFKKFKKKNVVRREPIRLALVAPNVHNAEMGEPYWITEDVATQPRTEPSQSSHSRGTSSFVDEDSAPLVPSSRRKLLSQIQEEGDSDDEIVPVSSLRRGRSKTPATGSTSRRTTRASSAQSEASAAAAVPPTRTQRTTQRTQRAPAKRTTQRVLLDESDDDEVFATAPPPPATGRSSRSTRSAVPASGTTLAAPSTRTRTSQRTQTTQRRKLLADDDDDDDDITFVGVQKKRRIG